MRDERLTRAFIDVDEIAIIMLALWGIVAKFALWVKDDSTCLKNDIHHATDRLPVRIECLDFVTCGQSQRIRSPTREIVFGDAFAHGDAYILAGKRAIGIREILLDN